MQQKKLFLFAALLLMAFAALMAGCGGGNSNNIVPTVFLQVNGQTGAVNSTPGQKLTVSWGGTNLAKCQATSSPIEADWDNPGLPTSGQLTIAPTQTVTLTVVCFSYPSGRMSSSVVVDVGAPAGKIAGIAFNNAGGCATATVLNGDTANCAATVTGTGDFDAGVIYSVTPTSAGTIDGTGKFTPAPVNDPTTVIVTATPHGSSTVTPATTAVAVKPVITGFSGIECDPATITSTATTTCGGVATGTAPFDDSVSMSVAPKSAGTMSPEKGGSYLFTPSAGFTGTATITVTSNGDPSQTTSVTVAVVRTVTIAVTQPSALAYCQTPAGCAVNVTFTVTGGASGDKLVASTPDGSNVAPVSIDDTTTAPFTVPLRVGGSGLTPGQIDMHISGLDGATSQVARIQVASNQSLIAENTATDEVAYLVPYLNEVELFTPDGNGNLTSNGLFPITNITNPTGITIDAASGDIVISGSGNPGARVFTTSGKLVGSLGSSDGIGVAADGGNACAVIANFPLVQCLPSLGSSSPGPQVSGFIGSDPVALDVAANTVYVYDAASSKLTAMAIPSMNSLGVITLPFPAITSGTTGNFVVKVMGNTVAVLGQTAVGQAIELVDVSTPQTMSLISSSAIVLPAGSFSVVPDPGNAGFLVEFCNGASDSGLTGMERISTTGVVTTLNEVIGGATHVVADTNGKWIYLGWGNATPPIAPNQ